MKEHQNLRVNRFDAVTSALMTAMLSAAAVTGALMLLWLVSRFESEQEHWLMQPAAIVTAQPRKIDGLLQGFDQPGEQEVEELIEPTLADSVVALTTVASRVGGSFTNRVASSNASSVGTNGGPSRPRLPGPDTAGREIIPRYERWQLNFAANDQLSYAKQLEFFKIELGVVGGKTIGLDIVNHLTGSPQSRRLEDASNEKRLYFMFKRPSPLMQYERAIHHQAGVELQDRFMFKLIPPELENLLAKIELDYCLSHGHSTIAQVARTVFQSKRSGSGFELQVIAQQYQNKR